MQDIRQGIVEDGKTTYYHADRMLLCRRCLFQSIVDHKIQEKIITAEDSADFPSTLEMDEQLLVHELRQVFSTIPKHTSLAAKPS